MMKDGERHRTAQDRGAALRRAREVAGLTQVEVADGVGVSVSSVKKWEHGDRLLPDTFVADRLAEFLGVSSESLHVVVPDFDTATLATIRRSRRQSAEALAEVLGISARTVARVEAGDILPPDPAAWTRALDITQPRLAQAWARGAAEREAAAGQ